MAKKDEVEMVVVEGGNFPALNNDLMDVFKEEMDGLEVDFDRVKIPSGGSLAFEVPGDDPDNPDMAKEIIGVIVDQHAVNAYWADAYTGQNNQPDCSSMDGKVGVVAVDGTKVACSSCPYNEWGSADEGGGKACKNMRRIYILQEGEMFPILLTLPPTSLKNFANYLAKRLLSKGHRSSDVLTKVSLKKAVSGGGIAYSQAVFALSDVLGEGEKKQMAEYAKGIRMSTRKLEISAEEYKQSGEDGDMPF